MKTLLLSVAVASLSVAAGALLGGCERALPSGITQQGGDAPLILDLDAAVGSESTSGTLVLGTELRFTVRGANKGHGEVGGATATFIGNGGTMCVIMDPENIWNVIGPNDNGNLNSDDGDADLFAGKTSDYTGIPGKKIGDFNGVYTDPLGVEHPLDNNLCIQLDQFGNSGSHAGSGYPEACSIQTDPGTSYLILSKTFAVPTNDDLLTEAIEVRPTQDVCPSPDGGLTDPGAVDETTLTSDNDVHGAPGGTGLPAGFNDPPAYVHP